MGPACRPLPATSRNAIQTGLEVGNLDHRHCHVKQNGCHPGNDVQFSTQEITPPFCWAWMVSGSIVPRPRTREIQPLLGARRAAWDEWCSDKHFGEEKPYEVVAEPLRVPRPQFSCSRHLYVALDRDRENTTTYMRCRQLLAAGPAVPGPSSCRSSFASTLLRAREAAPTG